MENSYTRYYMYSPTLGYFNQNKGYHYNERFSDGFEQATMWVGLDYLKDDLFRRAVGDVPDLEIRTLTVTETGDDGIVYEAEFKQRMDKTQYAQSKKLVEEWENMDVDVANATSVAVWKKYKTARTFVREFEAETPVLKCEAIIAEEERELENT